MGGRRYKNRVDNGLSTGSENRRCREMEWRGLIRSLPAFYNPPVSGRGVNLRAIWGPRSWTLNGSATARALGTPGPNRARQLPVAMREPTAGPRALWTDSGLS